MNPVRPLNLYLGSGRYPATLRTAKKTPRPGMQHLLLLSAAFGLVARLSSNSAPAAPDPDRYQVRTEHDPDGIGKFYMGREIAAVMGHQGADWLGRPERSEEENTDALMDQIKLRPGAVAADIGAGTGYMSRRLAKKVGPTGKVLAVDIQPEMLTQLTNRAVHAGITNIVPILGTTMDPKLPSGSVDLVLLVDVYHEFDFPYEMMQGICRALKPDGRVIFVEYRAEDPNVPIKPVHKMTQVQVKKEMSVLPLDWVQTIEVLPWQHIIVFQKHSTGH